MVLASSQIEIKCNGKKLEEACNALSWVYSSAGLLPITVDSFVKANLESLQRTMAKPVVKKEPITTEILEAIVQDTKTPFTLAR